MKFHIYYYYYYGVIFMMIQFSTEIIIIIANFSHFNSQYCVIISPQCIQYDRQT